MEQQRRSIRLGLAAIVMAFGVRILLGGAMDTVAAFLKKPETVSFLLYLETGRRIWVTQEQTAPTQIPTEPWEAPTTQPTEQTQPLPLTFTAADAALVDIRNSTGYAVDVGALLERPLTWDLTEEGPKVLIVHTHATEGYTQSDGYRYTESSYYRTLDSDCNMLRVGAYLTQLLRSRGIEVLHDTTLHDYPSYTGSYSASRKTVSRYLEENPSICLVLDLHRDALETDSGKQLPVKLNVDGASTAQLMLVMGTDAGGLHNPNWEENLALAVKLYARLERNTPGICRYISLRKERFNQDLSPGALLVEVGAAGNTMPEALATAEHLAAAIADLTAGSTS